MNHLIRRVTATLCQGSPWLVFWVGFLIACLNWIATDFGRVTHWMVLWSGMALSILLGVAAWVARQILRDLQGQEQQYHGVFEATSDAMLLLNREGTIVDANSAACTMYGYPHDKLVGLNSRQVVRAENVHFIERLLQDIGSNNAFFGEAVAARGDKSLFDMEFHSAPMALSDELHLLIVARDISDRKRTERELREYASALENANSSLEEYSAKAEAATRAKSGFLADMSHEIRTPLTAILGYAEWLRQDGDMSNAPASRVEAIDTIVRNGDHLLRLINDLLDLSKIEAGRVETDVTSCSVVEMVSRVQELLKSRATAKNLLLTTHIIGTIPKTIRTDSMRVHQILLNLVGNAIKFTESGSIRVEVRLFSRDTTSAKLEFAVIDTGIGMREDQATKLFKPYVQADHTIAERFGGTGLGLFVSRKLANLLGGDLRVASVLGQGSTFVLELPTGPLDGIPMIDTLRTDANRASPAPFGNVDIRLCARVLLAEDGLDNQRLISLILRKAGAEVVAVDNGQAAVETALAAWRKNEPFDVILMDMHMPILDGYGAVQMLRQAGYSLPVFALTAEAMQEDRRKCLAAGCDDYASKPIQRDVLLRLVAKVAQGREPAASHAS